MRFDDDYLWDGTGEPDPDVQRLEGLLAGYRHKKPAAEVALLEALSPARRRRFPAPALLAAAAALVMALAVGITWRGMGSTDVVPNGTKTVSHDPKQNIDVNNVPPSRIPADSNSAAPNGTNGSMPPLVNPPAAVPGTTRGGGPGVPVRVPDRRVAPKPVAPAPVDFPELATAIPVVDVETAKHLERATVLLQSFENARASADHDVVDVSYERERSRALLSANRALRLSAEASGNLPMEEALGGLEPFLIEISNLDASARKEDVASIQQRLERREISSELQLYAMNGPSAGM